MAWRAVRSDPSRIRTRDLLIHTQALSRLSYSHHGGGAHYLPVCERIGVWGAFASCCRCRGDGPHSWRSPARIRTSVSWSRVRRPAVGRRGIGGAGSGPAPGRWRWDLTTDPRLMRPPLFRLSYPARCTSDGRMMRGECRDRTHAPRRAYCLASSCIIALPTLPAALAARCVPWSRRRGSNPQPSDYETDALPSELHRRGGEDENRTRRTLLARQRRPLGTCLPVMRRAAGFATPAA